MGFRCEFSPMDWGGAMQLAARLWRIVSIVVDLQIDSPGVHTVRVYCRMERTINIHNGFVGIDEKAHCFDDNENVRELVAQNVLNE